MPVDKFGKRFGNRTVTQETSCNRMNDYFLRRDGSNTIIISMQLIMFTLTKTLLKFQRAVIECQVI